MQLSSIDIKLLARARASRKHSKMAFLLYPCLLLVMFGLLLMPPLIILGIILTIILLIVLSIVTGREAKRQEKAIQELVGKIKEGSDE